MKTVNRLACLALIYSGSLLADGDAPAGIDWSGPYAGVNLGVVWTNAQFDANHVNFLADDGVYADTHASADVNPGLQFGYLHQFANHWVVGGEADFSYPATESHTTTVNDLGNAFDEFTVRYDLQGSLRLRAGYAIDRFLPFVTAGVSFGSMHLLYNNEVNHNYGLKTTQTGWVLGAGCEYSFLDNLSARLEYLYTDYGNAMNLGIPTVAGVSDSSGVARADMSTNVLRAAVNYRF